MAREFTYSVSAEFPPDSRIDTVKINNSSYVVGTYFQRANNRLSRHGYIFSQGVLSINLDYPGSLHTALNGLNNSDVAVGYTVIGDGVNNSERYHGLIYDGRGFRLIDFPGARDTRLDVINNNGLIAGLFIDEFGKQGYFTYNLRNDVYKELFVAFNGRTTFNSINDNGVISGSTNQETTAFQLRTKNNKLKLYNQARSVESAFLSPKGNQNVFSGTYFNSSINKYIAYVSRNNSIMNVLPPGLSSSYINGINNKNQMPVHGQGQTVYEAYQYDLKTKEFSKLNVNPAGDTHAYSINANGSIAGSIVDNQGNGDRVFIAYPL